MQPKHYSVINVRQKTTSIIVDGSGCNGYYEQKLIAE